MSFRRGGALYPTLLPSGYRSRLEEKGAEQLEREGIKFGYETRKVAYTVPARDATYLLDFEHEPSGIILEYKGWFKEAKERQKYILVRNCNPTMDIRFVFQNANKKIYKGSKTTYGMWATEHGFPWADKGTIPTAWLNEMRQAETPKGKHGNRQPRSVRP